MERSSRGLIEEADSKSVGLGESDRRVDSFVSGVISSSARSVGMSHGLIGVKGREWGGGGDLVGGAKLSGFH